MNKILYLLACVSVTASLAACGLKRNLELPGHEHHKVRTQEEKDAPLDMTTPELAPGNDADKSPNSPDTSLPDNTHASSGNASNPAAK